MLGSWHPPAVLETCRGVTHTGFNRLACPARLTLPAVADSIGLGCFSDDDPPRGFASLTQLCCIPAVADCAGFVFAAPCTRVNLFPGCPSIPIRDVKDSKDRFSSWALAVSAPVGSDFFCWGVAPSDTNNGITVSGMTSVPP